MARTRPAPTLRQDVERFAHGTDARWRAEYRQAQYEQRLAGIQLDLFGAPSVEHFHRNRLPPSPEQRTLDYEIERFHDLTPEQQAQRLIADPQTPFARTTRKELSREEKAAVITNAANWLRIGQRVQILSAAASIDGSTERRTGREGVVWRLCSPVFADYVYINLDLVGQERSEKVVFVELRDVQPIES